MRYGDITLYPMVSTIIHKDPKNYRVIEYPRRNEAESHLLSNRPSQILATLIIPDMQHYLALRQMHRAHTEVELYISKFGYLDYYYKRVILEIGEQRPQEGTPRVMLALATFTCLDPRLYDAVTHEVIG